MKRLKLLSMAIATAMLLWLPPLQASLGKIVAPGHAGSAVDR